MWVLEESSKKKNRAHQHATYTKLKKEQRKVFWGFDRDTLSGKLDFPRDPSFTE